MYAKAIVPILNVTNLEQSINWFVRLGWTKNWEWGDPPSFACVGSGECEIFQCVDSQGGRGKGSNTSTFGTGGDETQDTGVWMTVWVDNVDEIFQRAESEGIEVVFSPETLSWGARECHLRHPDGHILRISQYA